MCKACKMDPREVERYRARQGAVPISDFDDEPRYRRLPRKTKKTKSVSKTPGCPGNDGKAHVYVWTTEGLLEPAPWDRYSQEVFFFRYYGFHRYERQMCAGCGKTKYGKRPTERYLRWKTREYKKRYGDEFDVVRGQGPVPRTWRYRRAKPSFNYFCPEKFDEDFMEKFKIWAKERGYPSWYYSYY